MNLDLIWLNKCNSNSTADWIYYRVTSRMPSDEQVEVCPVTFPKFEDKGLAVVTPFVMGLASVPDIVQEVLKGRGFDIDLENSVLIGVIQRN